MPTAALDPQMDPNVPDGRWAEFMHRGAAKGSGERRRPRFEVVAMLLRAQVRESRPYGWKAWVELGVCMRWT